MSKVSDLLYDIIEWHSLSSYDKDVLRKELNELIETVRAEEFEKHEAAGGFSCCAVRCPTNCIAKGTKYCEVIEHE